MRSYLLPIISAVMIAAPAAYAAVELPDVISDNAVFQQNAQAKLWGWAEPGKNVTVTPSWDGKRYKTVADKSTGRWEVKVNTPEASYTPYTVTFSDGSSPVTIGNVLIGEVWFCSGQSNMEMPLRGFWTQPVEGAAQAIAYSGRYPAIRMATVPKKASYTPQERVEGKWKVSNPQNAAEFSALAYFFARSLQDMLDVPVGIIACAYGGSKVEGWMPKWKLDTYAGWNMSKEQADSTINEWERIGVMYNAMLHPVIGYTVKGFLWNQGESNVGRHAEYPAHQRDMVQIWRDEWGLGELPFYFVELPGWKYGDGEQTAAALFRECQHKAAEITPNSGIVCTTDLVYPFELEDIHARKKQEIGERLAFMAANRTYGITGVPAIYPSYKSVELKGDKAVISFNNADSGLNPNMVLPGFEVAGEDRIFYPAVATEDWNEHTVTVSSDKVQDIKAVRYCFKNFAIGRVKDMFGMPLIPFRTDDWDDAVSAGDTARCVTVRDGKFYIGDSVYRYVGTNLWYGAILASEGVGGDRARLAAELDTLQAIGINNLRILVGGDGAEGLASHIAPTLQKKPGVYSDTLLQGLDYLLADLEKRDMKAVLYLNNAWEWSGGFSTYLEWAGAGKAVNPADAGYPAYMKYASKFVRNDAAMALAANHVRNIVSRVSSVTGKPYAESPAIMSWQIANEPRAFAEESKEPFAKWIGETARLIKSIDPNHLVSVGSEGSWGCENDMELWTRIHSYPEIDYATIHIWPYNWSWVTTKTTVDSVSVACRNTTDYINAHHAALARTLAADGSALSSKPIVLEEFGYPRDHMKIAVGTPVTARDTYYRHVFTEVIDGGKLAGVNFWGWGGLAKPAHATWQPGDDYTGDPAQEAQGLNSVFASDSTTIAIIKQMTSIKR